MPGRGKLRGVYLRRCHRAKDGKRHAYWALVKSVRTAKGPRQEVVAYLGDLDEAGRLGVQQAADVRKSPDGQEQLFDTMHSRWVEVDAAAVRVDGAREFGGGWLALQLIRKLGLGALLAELMPAGREDVPWSIMSLVLVICRLCDPSSELRIAEHLFERTALADLLGVSAEKINDDRLYRALDALLPHKDVSSMQEIVTTMEKRYGKAERVWAMDRGMVSEANIQFLKQGRRRYIVGTHKTMLRKYEKQLLASDWSMVHEGLEVKLCPDPDGTEETFILCRSSDRREKEKAMHDRFEKRIEEGLTSLAKMAQKRSMTAVDLSHRVGRLMGQNTRAAGAFRTEITTDAGGDAQLKWEKIEAWRNWARLSEGCYLLRSNVNDWTAAELWRAYMQLTEAEGAFRIHKSDLSLRPIWHQKAERVKAHVLVCFLAYVLWKTLGQMCKSAGLGDEPRKVLDEIAKVQTVDVILPTRCGREIRKRCVAKPTEHQAILLHKLGLILPRSLEVIDL